MSDLGDAVENELRDTIEADFDGLHGFEAATDVVLELLRVELRGATDELSNVIRALPERTSAGRAAELIVEALALRLCGEES